MLPPSEGGGEGGWGGHVTMAWKYTQARRSLPELSSSNCRILYHYHSWEFPGHSWIEIESGKREYIIDIS